MPHFSQRFLPCLPVRMRYSLLTATALSIVAMAQPSWAADNATWTGGTMDWNLGSNWNTGVAPINEGDTATFTGAGTTQATLSADTTISGIAVTGSTTYTIYDSGYVLNVDGPVSNTTALDIVLPGGVINFGGSSVSVTLSNVSLGVVTGAVGVASNAHLNNTAVSLIAGTLAFSGTGDGGSAAISSTGGHIFLTGLTTAGTSLGSLSDTSGGSESVTLAAKNLTLNGSTTATYDGAISGTGGSLTIALTGGASQTLSGANTYTGGTTVTSGTLIAGSPSAFGTGTVTIASAGTLSTGGINLSLGGLADGSGGGGSLTMPANAPLTIGSDNANTSFSGSISGSGSLIKTGGGTLTLLGSNTYTQGTSITGGILAINSTAAINAASPSPLTFSGGTLQSGASFTLPSIIVLGANGGTIDTNGYTLTLPVSGQVTGSGAFTKIGAGTLVLPANSSATGALSIQGGTVSIATNTALGNPSSVTIQNGAALRTTTALSISQDLTLAGQGGAIETVANASSLTGQIAGTGALIKMGSGSLTITGVDNTYSGGTQLVRGQLIAGSTNALGTGALTTSAGATASFGNFDQSISALNGTGGTVSSAGGTLTVQSGTYGGQITSGGILSKTGDGTLVLTGAGNSAASTSVSGGVLEVGDADSSSASLSSPVTVTAGGTLMGHGSILGAVQNSTGTVRPGGSIGTLTVNGDYNQASSGILAIELNPVTSSRLAVSGSAILGGTLAVLPDAGTYVPGTRYTILTAGNGIAGTFTSLTDSSGAVSFDELYLPNEVDLLSTPAGTTQRAYFAIPNQTPNEASATGAIAAILPATAQGTFSTGLVSLALAPATVPSQRTQLAGTLGELRADLATVDLANATSFQNFLVERMQRGQGLTTTSSVNGGLPGTFSLAMNGTDVPLLGSWGGPNTVPDTTRPTLWFHGYGVLGDAGGQSGYSDFQYRTGGLVAGIDDKVAKGTLIGIAAAYEHTDLNLSGDSDENNIDTYRGSIYLSQALDPVLPLVLDASVGYAFNEYQNNDVLALPSGAFQQSEHHYGSEITGDVGLSHSFVVPQGLTEGTLTLVPRAGVEYDDIAQRRYTTAGAPVAGLNLDTNGSTLNALRSTVGLRADLRLTTGDGTVITPELRATYLHDFMDTNAALTESFVGAPAVGFRIAGVHPGREAALAGAGVTVGLSPALSANIGYDAAVREHELDHTVQAGMDYKW